MGEIGYIMSTTIMALICYFCASYRVYGKGSWLRWRLAYASAKVVKSGNPSKYLDQIIMSPKCSIGGILIGSFLVVDDIC